MTASTLRVFSYGGGVQSTAALVLAADGRIDFPTFLFANVGDDSEDPATLAYVDEHARPYAAATGVRLVELHRTRRDGTRETLLERLTSPATSSYVTIPMRLPRTGRPAIRNCTADFKVRVLGRWLKAHGATATTPAIVGLGISTDEIHRARTDLRNPHQQVTFPLLDLRLSRQDCVRVIEKAGLPVPPKSACWFCPFHRIGVWREMKRDRPALFARAVDLEATINTARAADGRGPVLLTDAGVTLDRAVGPGVQEALDPGWCDAGVCFT